MDSFFTLAKISLSVPEYEIRLAIGITTLTAQDAKNQHFFAVQEVQDAIAERADVNINVVHLDPRQGKLEVILHIVTDQRERYLRGRPDLPADIIF